MLSIASYLKYVSNLNKFKSISALVYDHLFPKLRSQKMKSQDSESQLSVWPILFLLNVSTALKGTHLYIFIYALYVL